MGKTGNLPFRMQQECFSSKLHRPSSFENLGLHHDEYNRPSHPGRSVWHQSSYVTLG